MGEKPNLPRYLGDYRMVRPLAGSSNLVLVVKRDPQPHPRLYVVKLFHGVPSGTAETDRERYVPRVTRGLNHRNLVESYEVGEVEGRAYLVMEYVLSLDLGHVFQETRKRKLAIPLDVALYLGREVCRGLAFLHGFGADKLLHGRIAPSHILVAYSGQIKLAHVHSLVKAGSTTSVSMAEEEVIRYQAPEVLEGRPVDQRADVFAVGAILFECLSGSPLRYRRESGSIAQALPDAPPGALPDELPEEVSTVIERALKPVPGDRFRSAVDLGRRLDTLLDKHCAGAGGRSCSDWLVSLFGDELRARRQIQQRLLAEKRAETTTVEADPAVADDSQARGDLLNVTLDSRYRVRALVGEGGMGRVYEAEHVQLGKRLAVKVLHPLYSSEEEVVERFRREARSASAIGHPNIVNITDSGTTPDGRAYFVMELLDGVELADVITQEGPLDYERAVDIVIQVTQALGAAHQVGVIHRDMKPENVFLTTAKDRTDVVKILDFGIAKSARLERTRGGQLTEPGLAVGTPEYMAPEQAAGKPSDPRFDIYATSGILYAVLTGRPPFQGNNVMEILTKKATRNPTPPRSFRPDIPVELERAIMGALARNPDRRPQSMEEFEYELRKSLRGRPNAVAHLLGISDAMGAPSRSRRISSGELPTDGPRVVQPAAVPGGPTRAPMMDNGDTPTAMARKFPMRPVVDDDDDEPVVLPLDAPADATPAVRAVAAPAKAVDHMATTAPDIDAIDDEPPPGDERAKEKAPGMPPEARLMGSVLLGGLVLVVALALLLWPRAPTAKQLDLPPPAPAPGPPVDVPDGALKLGTSVQAVGLKVRVPAPMPGPVALAKRKELALKRWVAFAWRAVRDRRYLEPDRDNAKFGIQQIVKLDPEQPEVAELRSYAARRLLARAWRLRRKRKLEESEKVLRGLLELDPESGRAKRRLATVLVDRARRAFKKGQEDAVAPLLKESQELSPESPEPLLLAAEILVSKDKLADAKAMYEAVLKKHRRNRTARRALRKLRRKLRRRK